MNRRSPPTALLPLVLAAGCGGEANPGTGFGEGTAPPTTPQTTSDASTGGPPTTGPEPTSEATTTTTATTTTATTTEGSEGSESSTGAPGAATMPMLAVCGDGKVEGAEACDDGNTDDTDACVAGCVAAACGDGFLQAGVELCDDGNADDSDSCVGSCVVATCGDGFVQAGVEQCDDGDQVNDDGCLNTCVAAKCGDGVVWFSVEQCDDANAVDDDGCSNICALPGCGDGVVNPGEACDDGNQDNTDICLGSCRLAQCGDGFVNGAKEKCDLGGLNNDSAGPCKTNCTPCECEGTDVGDKTCADAGFMCGELGCDGCNLDTSQCSSPSAPIFTGAAGPDFTADGCWQQCEGYLDVPNVDDVPPQWGDDCTSGQFSKLRIACGASVEAYRYITVDKNVFKAGLLGYPELGLISEARDQDQQGFATSDEIYATGMHPHSGASWWGNGDGCQEGSASLTVNNEACAWEAAGCFGQGLAGNRFLWVYVAP